MMLVIGAASSGKREYVRSLGYTDADISSDMNDGCKVMYGLEEKVFASPAYAPSFYDALIKKDVVVCQEVGSGIIPITRHEREAREATGRLCCALAASADKVVRLVAGIPIIIKGQ